MSRRELILTFATAAGVLASSLLGNQAITYDEHRLVAIRTLAQALAVCERRHTE